MLSSPILSIICEKNITIKLDVINNCESRSTIISYILPHTECYDTISYTDSTDTYIVSTTIGYVGIRVLSADNNIDIPDVCVIACKRHDFNSSLSAMITLPHLTIRPMVLCLLTERNSCSVPECNCNCNSKWSTYHDNARKTIGASATVEIPTGHNPRALTAILNLFANGTYVSYKRFTY